MTPPERILQMIDRRTSTKISENAHSVLKLIIERLLDPSMEIGGRSYRGTNKGRDIELFKARCGYNGQSPMTLAEVAFKYKMSPGNVRHRIARFTRYLHLPLRPFIPFKEDHVARQAWDATCEYDVTCIMDPKADTQLEIQPRVTMPKSRDLSVHEMLSRICEPWDPETRLEVQNILASLFPYGG